MRSCGDASQNVGRLSAYDPRIGDLVRIRDDSRWFRVTGVSRLRSGTVLSLEHTALVTKIRTEIFTSIHNVTETLE